MFCTFYQRLVDTLKSQAQLSLRPWIMKHISRLRPAELPVNPEQTWFPLLSGTSEEIRFT